MGVSEERVLAIADSFQAAGLAGEGWHVALKALAEATGSQTGELIGIGSDAAVPLNIMTNMDPDFYPAFEARGGGNPQINPYVRAGMAAPVLKVLADEEFMSAEDYRRNPWYREFLEPWGIPHICLTALEHEGDMLIGLAVGRSRRAGHITPEQRSVFAAIAPHVRAAVRTQMALEHQSCKLLRGAFEGLGMAAYVCDRRGRVQVMTPAGEALVCGRGLLDLRLGCLSARAHDDTRRLADAIRAAADGTVRPGRPLASTLVLRQTGVAEPVILDIVRLSDVAHELCFNPRVLIVARRPREARPEHAVAMMRQAYGFTQAEAEVALQIVAGRSPEDIACGRRVSVGTIRMQLKAAMSKLGVRRQAELVSRLAQL